MQEPGQVLVMRFKSALFLIATLFPKKLTSIRVLTSNMPPLVVVHQQRALGVKWVNLGLANMIKVMKPQTKSD